MTDRRDIFGKAYRYVRHGLAHGAWPPGMQILATEVAQQLRSSATPVREAMSRLVGEGLLDDNRGHGYFVPVMQAGDVADLYALSDQLTDAGMVALDAPAAALFERAAALDAAMTALFGDGRLDEGTIASLPDIGTTICLSVADWSRSRVRALALQRCSNMLARVRAFEPRLLPDLAFELRYLIDLIAANDREALRSALVEYHARRRALAADLCFLAYENRPDR